MIIDTDKIFQSKLFKNILLGILILIAALLILRVGIFIGARKAEFSQKWSENYQQNFGGPRGGFFIKFSGDELIGANGTFGRIIKINFSKNMDEAAIAVGGDEIMEKIILANGQTVIRRLSNTINAMDLKVGEYIVAIGEPNDIGQIAAKFIRVMPNPEEASFVPRLPGLPF